jgi:hypothetical protein
MEPPRNPNSNAGHHHRHGLHRALHHHERVGLAGLRFRVVQTVGVLLAVLELERIERDDLGRQLARVSGSRKRSRRWRAVRRLWNPHFGHTCRLFSRSVK